MALNKKYVNQVTPELVIKTYAEHGQIITVDEAEKIIEFMYMLAEIALDIAEEDLKKEKTDGSNPNGFKTGSE
jgi:hypothetical protein